MLDVTEEPHGITFSVRVSPRASRSAVLGQLDGALKLALAAPPVDGHANAELCALLSRLLSVPKSAISIVRGERGKSKRVRVEGATAAQLRRLLDAPGAR